MDGFFVWRAVLQSMDSKVVAQVHKLMNRVALLEKAPGADKTPAGARKRGKNGKAGAGDKEDEDEDDEVK
jgi:heme exporter protein D